MFGLAHVASLSGPADFDGFRRQARRLLAAGVAPENIEWRTDGGTTPAPATAETAAIAEAEAAAGASAPALALRIGAGLLGTLQQAALHTEPQRFTLIYRLLWRIREQPTLQHDVLDADRVRIAAMAQAVRRDMHKMKAFVRFREVAEAGFDAPLHVAWFEPEHHIVEAVAPFFMRRFAGMRFAILTPDRSLRWDGRQMDVGPGADRRDAPPADAGEALWLTYYANIFNPARLKLKAMENEMPRKYWKNLPEAVLISPLAAAAMARSGGMVEADGTQPARRIPSTARAVDAPGHAERSAAPALLAVPIRLLPPTAPAAERQALLQERRALTDACRACPIGANATQAVHGEGPLNARLMLVGEQPGDSEDLRGRPFVGPAGQLLDRALAALGWPRGTLYLSNTVRHFKYEPRGKRRIHKTPAQQEIAACMHWLEEEIELVQPQALIALGATAARALLQRDVKVMSERGQWFAHASGRPVLVTLHPSALLRMEAADRDAAFEHWLEDLRQA